MSRFSKRQYIFIEKLYRCFLYESSCKTGSFFLISSTDTGVRTAKDAAFVAICDEEAFMLDLRYDAMSVIMENGTALIAKQLRQAQCMAWL